MRGAYPRKATSQQGIMLATVILKHGLLSGVTVAYYIGMVEVVVQFH